MTKAQVLKIRQNIPSDRISVVIDENIEVDTRTGYLLWNDTDEILTFIIPNDNSIETSDVNRRGKVLFTSYENIVTITCIPDLSEIKTWLPKICTDKEMQTRIENSFNQITAERFYVGGYNTK